MIDIHQINVAELSRLWDLRENHFCDFKAIQIAPAKLSRTVSAFANADGGELYVGIAEEQSTGDKEWMGFVSPEAANGLIQCIHSLAPASHDIRMSFLSCESQPGFVLHVEVAKSRMIITDTAGSIYLRRGAQNLPVTGEDAKRRLELNKGLSSFESCTVQAPIEFISESETLRGFMAHVVPHQAPLTWVKKQLLVMQGMPTVAGVLLFADEPQAALPKHCGIKIYRYRTSDEEGTRDSLDSHPITVEGPIYSQIYDAVAATKKIVEGISRMTPQGLTEVEYPQETLHEIITNAVLHRDYSIPDDIHIRIFDNRVEVESPGTLPGHITPQNILDERFARNGNAVRLINKFPNPPNKDVGEGLNTAFRAMKLLQLKDPEILPTSTTVRVIIKHEKLASPEERIMQYLTTHDQIGNGEARAICVIREDWRIRTIFSKMVAAGMIEKVPGSTTSNTAYRKRTPSASS